MLRREHHSAELGIGQAMNMEDRLPLVASHVALFVPSVVGIFTLADPVKGEDRRRK